MAEEQFERSIMQKEKVTLQEIIIKDGVQDECTDQMYYRGEGKIPQMRDGGYFLKKNCFYDFFTYFNALSLKKWRTYTVAEDICLELDLSGVCQIDLMGHYVNDRNIIQKEWLGEYYFDLQKRQTITLAIPKDAQSSVIGFQITAKKETCLYGGKYVAGIEMGCRNHVNIAMVTTTFCKEAYVQKNIRLLEKGLFQGEDFAEHFSWKIIDNGRTLPQGPLADGKIEIIPNKNVGGSGGFARGMLETIAGQKDITHILLMDDDVEFLADSFKRLYRMLVLIRAEYRDHFICGAMLEMRQKNIQHEDVGLFRQNGEHGPAKPRYDLNLWDSVVRNEEPIPADSHQYGGWWYCCIPSKVVQRDNLPLPFFVRGDDVEYAIRNHAQFITLNGICIWHEGFGAKFSCALELYQVHRNDLILKALRENLQDVDVIQRITYLFWEELYKFNYRGAALLLDAVEDYLKGPEFLKTLNGEQCMKEKRAQDNKLHPVTEELRSKVDYDHLYQYKPLGKFRKFVYDYSCNGQRMPRFVAKNKPGIIPYGWGYYQEKQYLTKRNYAIDAVNDLYVLYERSDRQFRELKTRFKTVMERYRKENETVVQAYKDAERELQGETFWKTYLE